ncbi:hypothetical protein U1Q18_020200 [Sarracenia purpurea var. burkii]
MMMIKEENMTGGIGLRRGISSLKSRFEERVEVFCLYRLVQKIDVDNLFDGNLKSASGGKGAKMGYERWSFVKIFLKQQSKIPKFFQISELSAITSLQSIFPRIMLNAYTLFRVHL